MGIVPVASSAIWIRPLWNSEVSACEALCQDP